MRNPIQPDKTLPRIRICEKEDARPGCPDRRASRLPSNNAAPATANPDARQYHPPSGFTLTEVIVALGIFTFAITSLMGVIPFGMNQVLAASNEARALTNMESIRDDVSLAIASHAEKSLRYGITLPDAGATTPVDLMITEDGETESAGGRPIFRIAGTLTRTTGEPVRFHLRTTWPAKAPAGREIGSVELVAAFLP